MYSVFRNLAIIILSAKFFGLVARKFKAPQVVGEIIAGLIIGPCPISLFVAFLALMAKWLLTLSSYVVAPLMLYIFGCGIYTVYRQTWDQFLILLVAEFLCFVLFVGATAMVEGVEKFSGWLRDLI